MYVIIPYDNIKSIHITNPPFGLITCPVMKFASSDDKNNTVLDMSKEVPILHNGVIPLIFFIVSSHLWHFPSS